MTASRVRISRTLNDRGIHPARFALFLLCCLTAVASGCTASRDVSISPRGAIEQLLLSRSLERSLFDLRVPMLEGAAVVMEIEGLPPDLSYVQAVVAERLGLQKSQIREKEEDAQYLVNVIVHSMGTEQARTLFGMPEVQAGFFPIALPELAVYKEELQKGSVRLSLAIYETSTGKLSQSIPWRAGSAYYNYYTILFFITFPATDLVLPPTPDSGLGHTIKRSADSFMEETDGER